VQNSVVLNLAIYPERKVKEVCTRNVPPLTSKNVTNNVK